MDATIQNTLSICIASFGDDIGALLYALDSGRRALYKDWTVEIIAGDQHPEPAADAKQWETQYGLSYLHHPNGLGRSNNRNTIANASSGNFLLFLDADALPVHPNRFLLAYCTALNEV